MDLRRKWLQRCAKQYRNLGNLSQEQAKHHARLAWNQIVDCDDDPLDVSPEAYADDDMSYWVDSHSYA